MSSTYEEILTSMQGKFKELAGFEADDASDIGIRLKVLAAELFSIDTNIEWLKNQMFPQTAIGKQLDYHAQERGIERKAASKSKGILKFSRPSKATYDISIPKGTVCSTNGSDIVRVVTVEDVTLPAGELSVTVEAQSEVGGSNTNVAVGNICVMVTIPAGMGSVTNTTAFTGGNDQESDEKLRERILFSYENISNGTNCAFYRDCALSFDEVNSVSVVATPRGSGSVDVYIAGKGGTVDSSLVTEVQSYINELREINVDAKVKSPSLVSVAVTGTVKPKSGYQVDDVINACKVSLQNYFDSLSIGQAVKKIDLYNAIFSTEGVENYALTVPVADITINKTSLAVKGILTFTEA